MKSLIFGTPPKKQSIATVILFWFDVVALLQKQKHWAENIWILQRREKKISIKREKEMWHKAAITDVIQSWKKENK